MLADLLFLLEPLHGVFGVFQYLTVRSGAAFITAFVLAIALGPGVIRRLKARRIGQTVRKDGPESHLAKDGTPTMGGILIVFAVAASTVAWAQIQNRYTVIALVSLLWLGLIGLLDDYLKLVRKTSRGLVERYKIAGQLVLGLGVGAYLAFRSASGEYVVVNLPLFDHAHLAFIPILYVAWVAFVLTAAPNAVNLTDGLDGLAAGLSAIAIGAFAIFAYLIGRVDTSSYLGLIYLPGAGELSVFSLAIVGAALGFLWHNAHPAKVFMGDSGSLAIGGAIGAIAVLLKSELLLVIVGGVFVLETLSVILQRSYFKYTRKRAGVGRRVFRMAPIHHHFEKLGWPEQLVVARFWIVGALFAMLGLATLKVR